MPIRKLLIFISIAMLAVPWTASAASVTHEEASFGGIITVTGTINGSDLASFRDAARQYPNALVILDSSGGLLMPALEIGKIISAAGFLTAVPEGASCASSCALIWLAGNRRFLDRRGRVGFHASYLNHSGRVEESGVANALIGGYLARLGFSEKAIIFATSAPPDQIVWLSEANNTHADIEFDSLDSPSQASNRAGITSPQNLNDGVAQDRLNPWNVNILPLHLPASLSSGGSRWVQYRPGLFYDANSIEFVRDINMQYAGRKFWSLLVAPLDLPDNFPKGLSYSLVQYFVYCPDRSVATQKWIDHFSDGRRKRKEKYETGGRSAPAEPGSTRQVLVNNVCAFER